MKKSIYDGVLELFEVKSLELFEPFEQALKQAQKQEKLLELYKDLITVKDDMFSCCEVVDDEYYGMAEIETDLEQQIKELER